MTTDETWWEPPLAGHRGRAAASARSTGCARRSGGRRTASTPPGCATGIGPSALTLGGLLKHLAAQEDYTFAVQAAARPMPSRGPASAGTADHDWEFASAADDTPEELYALYDGAVARSRARLADGARRRRPRPAGRRAPTTRRTPACAGSSVDLVEEYGRHTGHADLLREAVDGRIGEDPPPGWRP